MKTRELIALLQEEDPSGEMDCCIGNCDILDVITEPAYWDGCKQVLVRDNTKECYNVVGAKISSKGHKVVLTAWSVQDALRTDPTLPIEYDDFSEDNYKEFYEKERLKYVYSRIIRKTRQSS